MRAVFTVQIPAVSAEKYPSDEEFLSRLRVLGWDYTHIKDLAEDERKKWYFEEASALWEQMPEIANDEKNFVIFYGKLPDNHTKFIVTRLTDGQATFRLLHPHLDRLQASTYYMIEELIKPSSNITPLQVRNRRISIYEIGHNEIIIKGRVIESTLQETVRTDRKNMLIALGALLISIPCFIALIWINSQTNRIVGGTLERVSTAFLTTFIVSAIGFLQTYLEIRKHKLIDWQVASTSNSPNS